jgi:hypothetical protein
VGAVGAVGGSASASPAPSRFFTIESVFMTNGDQTSRAHNFLSHALVPAAQRFHRGPLLILEAVVAAHVPQLALIAGFPSSADALAFYTRLHEQEGFTAAVQKWESSPNPPYEQTSSALLEAAEYSPEFPEPAKSPRVFELRVYHSPTWRQLDALHQRFAAREVPIFHRCGIHPVLYASTAIGPNLPNLTYLIPFDDLAAREKAWNAFTADAEWQKVRAESVAKDGEIVSSIQISLFRATVYSPFR